MQTKLGRFSAGPDEQQDAAKLERVDMHPQERDLHLCQLGRRGKDIVQGNRPGQIEQSKHPQQEAEIANPVDDKGLDGCRIGRGFLEPETDQQIRGDANTFPAKEDLQKVVPGHQGQHREGKEAEIGKEAGFGVVFLHIADRVEMDEAGHAGHHHQHHTGQLIDPDRPIGLEIAGADPAHDGHRRLMRTMDREERDPAEHRTDEQQDGRNDHRRLLANRAMAEPGDQHFQILEHPRDQE